MKLRTEAFLSQNARWHQQGRVILAQAETDSIFVYQAYRPAIGHFAAKTGTSAAPVSVCPE